MPSSRLAPCLAVALLAATGCSTYSVRKSALVPHMAPPMRSGQGMGDVAAEAAFGASTLGTGERPHEGADSNAGLYIPRVELGAALRGRLTDSLDVGLLWDHGFRSGAYATSKDQPSPDNGSVYGGGVSFFYSMPTGNPGFRLGMGLDLMLYSIPYVEYRTCVTNCYGEPYTTSAEDRDNIGVYSLALIPSWRFGRLTIFGGGTMRNHPTIEKGSLEGDFDTDDEVENGPPNLVIHGGAEIGLGGGVRVLGTVYQPVTQDPVDYGPTVGVALSLPLARSRPPAPPRSTAPGAVAGRRAPR